MSAAIQIIKSIQWLAVLASIIVTFSAFYIPLFGFGHVAAWHICEDQKTIKEVAFLFLLSGDPTQFNKLDGKLLYPLNFLSDCIITVF